MTDPVEPGRWAMEDLQAVVEVGLVRGRELLDPAEQAVAERILAMKGAPAMLLARIAARVRDAYPVDSLAGAGVPDPHEAVEGLMDVGLLVDGSSWADRLAGTDRGTLSTWCRALGLPRTGRREDLVERLLAAPEMAPDERWVTWPHGRLVLRLERFATLRKEPDRGWLVAERLGHIRWPEYSLSSTGGVFADRRSMLIWEDLYDQLASGALDPERALEALARREGEAPGRLSLKGRLVRCVLASADTCVRDARPLEAVELLTTLERACGFSPARLGVRIARAMEIADDRAGALKTLRTRSLQASREERLGYDRAGRRLARSLGRTWAPARPIAEAPLRRVRLNRGDAEGRRPLWRVGDELTVVEDAVGRVLAREGRQVVRTEGPIATGLLTLIFAEACFAPVDGMLPVPRLEGPLDWGTSSFAKRRARWVDEAVADVRVGRAVERIRATVDRFGGCRLAGVGTLTDEEPWVSVAEALGPVGLMALLEPLLERGASAAAGLPDLLVLPGPACRIEEAFPPKLGQGASWIEVKGPGDTLRDAQRVWLERLIAAGMGAEVWAVDEVDPGAMSSSRG